MEGLLDGVLLDDETALDRLAPDGDIADEGSQPQIVFDGKFSRAVLYQTSATDLVVCFDHWVRGRTAFSEARASQFYPRLGFSQLLIQTSRNDWFLSADLPELLKACGAATRSFQNVVCYGFSMGGYGAMIFSAAVRAQKVIMISPQVSINPKKVPFENRWYREATEIDFSHEIYDGRIAQDAKGFVVFDPFHKNDARHAARILAKVPGWQAVCLRHGFHPATQLLEEAGTLSSFGQELLTPVPRMEQLLQLHRAARFRSATYWLSLIERTHVRRPAIADSALRHALSCRLGKAPAPVAFQIGLRAFRTGIAQGTDIMDSALTRAENPPEKWGELVRIALRRRARQLSENAAALELRNQRLQREVQDLKKLTRQYRVTSPIWWYRHIRSAFKNK